MPPNVLSPQVPSGTVVVGPDATRPSLDPLTFAHPMRFGPIARPGRHVRNIIVPFVAPAFLNSAEWDGWHASSKFSTLYSAQHALEPPIKLTTLGSWPAMSLVSGHTYTGAVTVFNNSPFPRSFSVEVDLSDGSTYAGASVAILSKQSAQLVAPPVVAPLPSLQNTPDGSAYYSFANLVLQLNDSLGSTESFAVDDALFVEGLEPVYAVPRDRPDLTPARSPAQQVTIFNNYGSVLKRIAASCIPDEPGISPFLEGTLDPLLYPWTPMFPQALTINQQILNQGSLNFYVRAVATERSPKQNHDIELVINAEV